MDTNQYLDMFIDESKEHLQAINDNLLELEKNPKDIDIVKNVFRSAHTIKGMSATMGFEDIANLTHELENVLDQVRNEITEITPEIMDVIFQSVDLLEGMVYSIIEGSDGKANVAPLVEQLKAIASGQQPTAKETKQATSTDNKSDGNVDGSYGHLLDEYQKTVILQSQSTGHNALHISISLSKDCMLKAARVFMIFDALEGLGEVILADPAVEDLEDEKFDLSFELVFLTAESKDLIKGKLVNISEVAEVEIKNIDLTISSEDEDIKADVEPTVSESALDSSKQEQKQPTEKNQAAMKTKPISSKTIRVDIERLDVLMNLFSELVIDRGRLEQIARELGHSELVESVEHMSRISGDLQNLILNMRMVPIEQVFNRFPRMIRDLSKDLNKKVELDIKGADTELDRTVIDEIGDPLVHLLRNSLDHGLESPEERIKKGKPETGKIQLHAYHSGNHVFIEIIDDGNGLDRQKILNKAIERGLLTEEQGNQMSDQQVFMLLFQSGFSTAKVVTDVSGRGVGLDVVRSKIEALSGQVHIESKLGEYTKFQIELPLTLSIIQSMLIRISDEKYAIPLSSIIETAVFSKKDIYLVQGQQVIDFRGHIVPLVSLEKVFAIPRADEVEDDEVSVIVVKKGDKMAGLIVDDFIGQQEIVLKNLGTYLPNVFAISGATILGDGQVALIIDCNALIQ
ncbi:chemotaxis protein CheA [Desulfuribacillus alkaliarsenatis]|uniref:Chemotaxis protein CheA n=1 Tax=Desulfuribacillus alkaliarsenatis TaxID=766136 RepID=A0A1E5G1G7_9FIRM|nr:chemotaxis protein CheA [Desulfuribacillus alkaliarsenatis]OEF96288.1 chemotaxis protein CheA [Desulfuribacillus alkaliarsenatis]